MYVNQCIPENLSTNFSENEIKSNFGLIIYLQKEISEILAQI